MEGQGIEIARAFVSVEPDMRKLEAGFAAGDAQAKAFARSVGASTGKMASTATADAAKVASAWTSAGKSMQSAGATMVAAGKKTSTVGSTLNKTVTLPLVAIGAVAGKLSLDFGRSMQEIGTQAGASRKEVAYFKREVERLGAKGRYSQGPKDLSAALFDIRSTGIKGAQAMKALAAASDLATVGNADLESTTSGLVGVLRTGIKGAGDMQAAIGTLNATIGAGKMHMEDLNAAIGTGFLGSAKGLGISLGGVGAALAELTSQGVPANSAATRLRMTMSLLANPTEKAAKVLDGIGIGSEDLAKRMRSSGSLIPALEELQTHMQDLTKVQQGQLLSAAFGGAKSGGTIIQLLGQLDDLGEKQKQIFENTKDVGNAIAEANQDPAIKFQKVWSALQFDLIKLGNVLIPALEPVIMQVGKEIADVATAFDGLSPATKEWAVKAALVAAALGPVLSLTGKIMGGFGQIVSLAGKAAEAIGGASAAEGVGAAASGAAGADAKKLFLANSSGAVTGAVTVGGGEAATGGMAEAGAAAAAAAPELLAFAAAAAAVTAGLVVLYKNSEAFRREVDKLAESATRALGEIEVQIEPLTHAFGHLGHAIDNLHGPIGAIAGIFKGGFVTVFENAFAQAEHAVEGLGKTFSGEIQVIRGIVNLIANLLEGRFDKAWVSVKTIFRGGVHAAVGVMETITAPMRAAAELTGTVMTKAFDAAWGKIESIFSSGVSAVVGIVNTVIDVLNKIPGVDIGHVGGGGGVHNTAKGGLGKTKSGADFGHHFSGGQITKPRAIVGEEAPAHNEWVIATNPAYRDVNLGYWRQAGKDLGVPGFAGGGLMGGTERLGLSIPNPVNVAGEAAGAVGGAVAGAARDVAGDVIGAGAEKFIGMLPKPNLPEPFAGVGPFLIDEVTKWIKDGFKSKKIGQLSLGGGALGFTGAPANMKELGDNSYVDAHTLAVTAALDKMFGLTMSSGYRSPAHNAAIGGAPGSLHTHGSPSNPGATDSVGSMAAMNAYIAFARQHVAGLQEAMVDNYAGLGSNAHLGFFGEGGLLGKVGALAGGKGKKRGPGPPALPGMKLLAKGGGNGMTVTGKVSYFSGEATAGGKDANTDPGLALNLHPGTESGWDNATTDHWMALSNAGNPVYGKTTIGGHTANLPIIDKGPAGFTGRAIDVTAPGVAKLGFTTSNFPTDATGTVVIGSGGAGGTKTETVPGMFHGAHTHSLSFGGIPKSLPGIEKEIRRWEGELKTYGHAVKEAKGKPKTQRALQANVTAIEKRLKELRHARAQERRKAAQKKFTKRLTGKLGKLTGFETDIEGKERSYEIANQYAEQLVDQEPTMPELPNSASEGEREAAEKTYVQTLQSYVDGKERPAYAKVLERENEWRNTILSGESAASGMETGWEGRIRKLEAHIKSINEFSDQVADDVSGFRKAHPHSALPPKLKNEEKKRNELLGKLPMMRFKEGELRKVLGEGRGQFYLGADKPIHPPMPPLAGTGNFEDALQTVQGVHWPDQHSKLAGLPSTPQPGMFGGAIWDTQTTMQELGLKVPSPSGGGAGGVGLSDRDQQLVELADQIVTQQNERNMIESLQKPILDAFKAMPPFGGSFGTGGEVPGPAGAARTVIAHGGETITPAGASSSAPVVYVIIEDGAVDPNKIRVVANEEIDVRMSRGGRAAGRGMPGGAGGNFAPGA